MKAPLVLSVLESKKSSDEWSGTQRLQGSPARGCFSPVLGWWEVHLAVKFVRICLFSVSRGFQSCLWQAFHKYDLQFKYYPLFRVRIIMTNTLLLKLRERLRKFKTILHFCVLGRTQSLFVLNDIVYAVLAGNNFKKKRERNWFREFCKLFPLGKRPKKVKANSIVHSPPPNVPVTIQTQAAAVGSAKPVYWQMGFVKETIVNGLLPIHWNEFYCWRRCILLGLRPGARSGGLNSYSARVFLHCPGQTSAQFCFPILKHGGLFSAYQ